MAFQWRDPRELGSTNDGTRSDAFVDLFGGSSSIGFGSPFGGAGGLGGGLGGGASNPGNGGGGGTPSWMQANGHMNAPQNYWDGNNFVVPGYSSSPVTSQNVAGGYEIPPINPVSGGGWENIGFDPASLEGQDLSWLIDWISQLQGGQTAPTQTDPVQDTSSPVRRFNGGRRGLLRSRV